MTAVHPDSRIAERPTVLLAGVPWPIFKLEALALGLVALLILLLVTGSPAVAVLGGAGLAAGRWVLAAVSPRLQR
ncbi:hypothetical protein [Nocardia harenae]|uniref:hypothetical protein n=1 Tax=Nocardia harenae TaxID=358707 RepID=UPI0008336363|nr:hypothetical protein [Nocardia harenae]